MPLTDQRTPRRKLGVAAAILLTAGILVWLMLRTSTPAVAPATSETTRTTRPLMGTTWNVEVVHNGNAEAAGRALNDVFLELERIDRLMSEWKPDSPVSAINRAAGKWVDDVPEELRSILERSIAYGEKSNGAFDITWRGMGSLWHFDEQFHVPTQAEVDRARANVDYRAIDIEGSKVRLRRAGMAIGLGGIAKGYAIDRAAATLRNAGLTSFLVDGGGDILVSGTRRNRAWRLGIQDPRGEHGALLGRVNLIDGALVTSGDYERFRIVGGVRYHHIIDPRTGWPATACRSVSVIAKSAEQADALATAIFVLGPKQGIALAEAEHVDVLIIDSTGRPHSTEGFRRVFESE